MKRPAFQFYPADWRKDSALQLCSIAARGLWIEMLCIAHECEEYGKLKQNGMGFSHQTLAKLAGLSPQTCKKLLDELQRNGVFSRDEEGAIYSRRMIRDEYIRNIRAEAGSKGGSPFLLGNLVKQNGKQKQTPSSSFSSASSKEEAIVEIPANLQTPEFRQAWEGYLEYRKKGHKKSLLPTSQVALLKQMSEWGHDAAISSINQSIAQGWQGIFEPKATFNGKQQKPRAASCL
jgi:hypothetical protein